MKFGRELLNIEQLLHDAEQVFVLRTISGDACPLSCVSAEACLTGWPIARGRMGKVS